MSGQALEPVHMAPPGRKRAKQALRFQNKAFILPLFSFVQTVNLLGWQCQAVRIDQIKVPPYIENGTTQSVVLDCLYTLESDHDQHGLVVKWFFNDDAEPIYQWIYELNNRHVPKRYENRVNINYKVNTTDPRYKYRALNLVQPTVAYTGKYSCHVITYFSQASREANMVVYGKHTRKHYTNRKSLIILFLTAKAQAIDLKTRRVVKEQSTALQQQAGIRHSAAAQSGGGHSAAGLSSSWWYDQYGGRLTPSTTTEIKCAVNNVYPLPELSIYQISTDGLSPISLTNARIDQNITELANGAYSVSLTAFIEDSELLHQQQHQQQMASKAAALQAQASPYPGYHPRQPVSRYHTASSMAAPSTSYGTGVGSPAIFECLVSQEALHYEIKNRTLYTPSLGT